ncbi:MAG: phosphoribosyl-ATP diphosphatase [Planctomycetota bacterium]|nr:phosphoribosyl-ATP diphosphatase [Planctomycetota bacterium]
MIIPSIDIMNGRAVQLIGGEQLAIDAGDPRPIAERFAIAGEIAVIDLDAAMNQGSNAGIIRELCAIAPCRVGGGIRTVYAAIRWLDAGAAKIILGSAAREDLLAQLPRERTIAALDARNGSVVVDGWKRDTGQDVITRMRALRELVGGFLVTFVEREGRMTGLPFDRVEQLITEAGDARLTIAGGVRTTEDIARADQLGADAQVGMALYTGAIDLADCIAAPLTSDRPDKLIPTIVADERGAALGLAYSSPESIREAVRTRAGVYYSRSRRALWRKGESSGAAQRLLRIDLDCDRDALRFTVEQQPPGFCHNETHTCFGPARGAAALEQTISPRLAAAPPNSYTRRLLEDPTLLRAKLLEEAAELAETDSPNRAAEEFADLFYFALTTLRARGATLADVDAILDRRALKLTRRPGDAKPAKATP